MGIDELEEALRRKKTGETEETFEEIITQALGIEPALFDRILFAQYCLNQVKVGWDYAERAGLYDDTKWEEKIPNTEVREAIRRFMLDGGRRVLLSRMIRNSSKVYVPVSQLIPRDRAEEICNGCPERLECVAESLHTPDECYVLRKNSLPVTLMKIHREINQVEVHADQPYGTYKIPIRKIILTTPTRTLPWEEH